ncbi:hypothetical protein ACKVWM_000002 [Pyricularia oryzae]
MKFIYFTALISVLAVAIPTGRGLTSGLMRREGGEVSTNYIFTDNPAEGGKTTQKKKREGGEVSTNYIFTDDPAEGGKATQ